MHNPRPPSTSVVASAGTTDLPAKFTGYQAALREATKLERRAFTDAVAAFNTYADSEGASSSAPDRAFGNFTRQVYAAFGLNKKQVAARINDDTYGRDAFDAMELLFVQAAERAATHAFVVGMNRKLTRAEIKAGVKRAIQIVRKSFAQIADNEMFSGEVRQ